MNLAGLIRKCRAVSQSQIFFPVLNPGRQSRGGITVSLSHVIFGPSNEPGLAKRDEFGREGTEDKQIYISSEVLPLMY